MLNPLPLQMFSSRLIRDNTERQNAQKGTDQPPTILTKVEG